MTSYNAGRNPNSHGIEKADEEVDFGGLSVWKRKAV